MCSELTPRARIPDTRIPQRMQPCAEPCTDITDCYYLGSYVGVKELLLEFLGILFRWKGIRHDKISLLFWTSAHSNKMGQIYVRQR